MTLEVAPLTHTHVDALHELLVTEGWTNLASEVERGVQPPRALRYVALADAEVVGFLEGTFWDTSEFACGAYPPPRARVSYMLVAPRARRRGVGRALLHQFVADAQDAGLHSVALFPDPRESGDRLAFFAACGLEQVTGEQLWAAPLTTATDLT
ncbi:GNAT family N-acetyltransferase [Streptomyces sp. NPDC058864]